MPGAPRRLRAQVALASGSLLGPRDQAATARGVWCPKRYNTCVASLVPLVASAPCFLAPRVHGGPSVGSESERPGVGQACPCRVQQVPP